MHTLYYNVSFISTIGIIYQLKRVKLEDGKFVFCLWVSRDPEDPYSKGVSYNNFTIASSLDSSFGKSQNTSQSISHTSQSISHGTSSLEDSAFGTGDVSMIDIN